MSKARHHRRDARRRGQQSASASASAVTSARRADTGLHAPTAAEVRAARRTATQPRKRSAESDAITGEPLTRGTFRLWMRDYDTARELYRGEPIPYSLHSRQMETGGGASGDYLGAHVLSRAALRYFAHAVVSASQAIDGQYAWWLDGYVVGRLTAHFGERAVMSAAVYERSDVAMREIARVYDVPQKWVLRWSHRIQRAARGYFQERRAEKAPARPAVYREPTGSLTEFAESA